MFIDEREAVAGCFVVTVEPEGPLESSFGFLELGLLVVNDATVRIDRVKVRIERGRMIERLQGVAQPILFSVDHRDLRIDVGAGLFLGDLFELSARFFGPPKAIQGESPIYQQLA